MDSLAHLKGKQDVESCCAMMKECCQRVSKFGREAYMLEESKEILMED